MKRIGLALAAASRWSDPDRMASGPRHQDEHGRAIGKIEAVCLDPKDGR